MENATNPHEIAVKRIAAIDAYLEKPSLVLRRPVDLVDLRERPFWQQPNFWQAAAPASVVSLVGFASVQPWLGVVGLAWGYGAWLYYQGQKYAEEWQDVSTGGSDLVTNWPDAVRAGRWLRPVAGLLGQDDSCVRGVGAVVPDVLPGTPGVQAGRLYSFGVSIVAGQVWVDHDWFVFLRAKVPPVCGFKPFVFGATSVDCLLPSDRELAEHFGCEQLKSWHFDDGDPEEGYVSLHHCRWYGAESTDIMQRLAGRSAKLFEKRGIPYMFFYDGTYLTWLVSIHNIMGADTLAAAIAETFGNVDSLFAEVIAWERRSLLKQEVLLHAFERQLRYVQFRPGKIPTPDAYFESWLEEKDIWPVCEDLVVGQWGPYQVLLFEAELEGAFDSLIAQGKSMQKPARRSLHMMIKGGHRLSSPIQIIDRRSPLAPHLPPLDVTWEVAWFEERYQVCGRDEVEARFALPMNLQERILRISDRWRIVIDYTIREDELYMVIRDTKDLFEPKFDLQATEQLYRKQIDSLLEVARELRQ